MPLGLLSLNKLKHDKCFVRRLIVAATVTIRSALIEAHNYRKRHSDSRHDTHKSGRHSEMDQSTMSSYLTLTCLKEAPGSSSMRAQIEEVS